MCRVNIKSALYFAGFLSAISHPLLSAYQQFPNQKKEEKKKWRSQIVPRPSTSKTKIRLEFIYPFSISRLRIFLLRELSIVNSSLKISLVSLRLKSIL